MNYERIYNNLIQKRRINKINRTDENKNIQYHHIIPVSCGGNNDKRHADFNNECFNIIGLTLDEHFFAHLLLVQIYKQKYGKFSKEYKCMLKAISLMQTTSKYGKIKTSKLYKLFRLKACELNLHKTTLNCTWVTNGKIDKLLKPGQQIPRGFKLGRTINFTEAQRQQYSKKISIKKSGSVPWNKGKTNIYSEEYKMKISKNHADFSGDKNGRFGSRSMFNIKTQTRKIVSKEEIQNYLDDDWIFSKQVSIYNNGQKEIYSTSCPPGFKYGKLQKNKTIRQITNLNTGQNKFVSINELDFYLNNGYILYTQLPANKKYQKIKRNN